MFTLANSEDEYGQAATLLDQAAGRLDGMQALSGQLNGFLADDIAQLKASFDSMGSGLDSVHDGNRQATQAIAEMISHGTEMDQSTTDLYNLLLELIDGIAAGGNVSQAYERTKNVLVPVEAMGEYVTQARLASRPLMLVQDASAVPEIYAALDTIQENGAAVEELLTAEQSKEALDRMMKACTGFRTSVQDVEKILASSAQTIDSTKTVFFALNDKVNGFSGEIDVSMEKTNNDTIDTSQSVMLIMILVGVFATVFSVAVAFILARMITRPLGKMKAVLLQAGTKGNMHFDDHVRNDVLKAAEAQDEIGQSLKACAQMIDHIRYVADCLESVASNDLTADIRLLSDEDTMGLALKKMIDSLNDMFAEINTISGHVAASSNELSMGAQSLAAGSTEQAATVEEISASANEINSQMDISSQAVGQAAAQGDEINRIAADGSVKMSSMMRSMEEINEASKDIARVIKAIDDIAFQTNILSLNAAVEAARAGPNGKGFAVVAEEVRNLSAKSTTAAKETEALINANIQKAEQGVSTTKDTAASLEQIIDGIQETNVALRMVADQSNNIKAATTQVSAAIDQVAQVVQQNSATSEESAAASQQLNSQAQILKSYIARFKLKNAEEPPYAPPEAIQTGLPPQEPYLTGSMGKY